MRRMITKNGVIDAVNEGIESGEIEVGGGLPEIEEGDAGKVLKVNEAEDGVEWGEAGGVSNYKNLGTMGIISSNATSPSITNPQNILDGTIIATYYNSAIIQPSAAVKSTILLNCSGIANSSPITGSILLSGYQRAYGSLTDSICIGSALIGSSSGKNFNAISRCLFVGTQNKLDSSFNNNTSLQDSIVVGENIQLGNNNYGNYFGLAIFGNGHSVKFTTFMEGAAIVGSYGILDNYSDKFVVGAGGSGNLKNCFTAGRNNDDGHYIKIGTTKLTETQLQALLATLS